MVCEGSEKSEVRSIILIVEDHASVRASLCSWLSGSFEDCRILESSSGEEAIALAGAEPPDVVIMDIGLPGMNGIEATRKIKVLVPGARVVVVSIFEEHAYRADASTAGADGYVTKRQMTTELIPLVEKLLLPSRSIRT